MLPDLHLERVGQSPATPPRYLKPKTSNQDDPIICEVRTVFTFISVPNGDYISVPSGGANTKGDDKLSRRNLGRTTEARGMGTA